MSQISSNTLSSYNAVSITSACTVEPNCNVDFVEVDHDTSSTSTLKQDTLHSPHGNKLDVKTNHMVEDFFDA